MQVGERAAGIHGSMLDRVFRSADFCDAEPFDRDFGEWLSKEHLAVSGPRVLLIGNTPPDERLHREVEEGGANVVSEGDPYPSRWVNLPPILTAGSLDAIADHY